MAFTLDRCDGPTCPRCGCTDTEVTREPTDNGKSWWGSGAAICRNCRIPFVFRKLPLPVVVPPLQPEPPEAPQETIPAVGHDHPVDGNGSGPKPICCPDCGSTDVKVRSTRKDVRYYLCRGCQARFKLPRKGDIATVAYQK